MSQPTANAALDRIPGVITRYRQPLLWLIMAAAIAAVASFLPRGFDYIHVFSPHIIPSFYVPWTDGMTYLLPWPIQVSATVMALVVAIRRHGGSVATIALAIISWPTIWVLLLGQLEGIALLGFLMMPWSVPVWLIEHGRRRGSGWWIALLIFSVTSALAAWVILQNQGTKYYEGTSTLLGQQPEIGLAMLLLLPWVVPVVLLKPQIMAFALLGRKSWTVSAAVWITLSVAIWGFWLPNLLTRLAPEIKAVQPQDVSLFPWSLIAAAPMLWLARGDPEMLMAAGSLAIPTVHPYQYIVLMPALARLPIKSRLICWGSSFLTLGANYFGSRFWLTGNLFPVLMWIGLWLQRRRNRSANDRQYV